MTECYAGCPDCKCVPWDEAKESILEEAQRLVSGPRRDAYGAPSDNHRRTAMLWSAWLACRDYPRALSAEDVAIFNVLQKLSREAHEPSRDSLVDIIGYVLNIDEMRR